MKTINQAVEELENLVQNELPRYNIPYKQGRTIRIGKIIIRRSQRNGYMVIDTDENATVTTAFSKHGAVAIAKAYSDGHNIQQYEKLDNEVAKHFIDSVFYNNSISVTKDEFRKNILEDRLEISEMHINHALESLEKFILTIQ
tara:strand:- start:614 stop:1042 length:429 start_codon:yes stop_codon:yes gene_type:complete